MLVNELYYKKKRRKLPRGYDRQKTMQKVNYLNKKKKEDLKQEIARSLIG